MTTPPPSTNEAALTVNAAITRGVEGDVPGGAEMLLPLMTSGVGTLYALIAMLAQLAGQVPRTDPATGTDEAGPTGDVPPELVFAAEFTTAWTSRDHDRAETLFDALYRSAGRDGEELLVAAVVALFQMAVAAEAATDRPDNRKAP